MAFLLFHTFLLKWENAKKVRLLKIRLSFFLNFSPSSRSYAELFTEVVSKTIL